MKELEDCKKEIGALKKDNEQLKIEKSRSDQLLKNLNASYVALKQGHDFFVNDGQQIRTQLVLEQQKNAEAAQKEKQLVAELAKQESKIKELNERLEKLSQELDKVNAPQNPVHIPDNVEPEQKVA